MPGDDNTGVPLHPGLALAALAAERASLPGLDTGRPWRCADPLDAPVGGVHLQVWLAEFLAGNAMLDPSVGVLKLGLAKHFRVTPEFIEKLSRDWAKANGVALPTQADMRRESARLKERQRYDRKKQIERGQRRLPALLEAG